MIFMPAEFALDHNFVRDALRVSNGEAFKFLPKVFKQDSEIISTFLHASHGNIQHLPETFVADSATVLEATEESKPVYIG